MTRAAKLSLREFYEHHGKPVEASLPKKSGYGASADQARDGDQTYHTRLAGPSIDTSKPYCGPCVDDAGYGQGGSRVDVDYDYYGAPKQSSFAPPRPSHVRSYAPLVGGTGYAGTAAAAKPARTAVGDSHAQPVTVADAACNPACSRSGFYAGPCAGPPASATAPGEDVWYPPPPPPPPRRVSPTAQAQVSPPKPKAAKTAPHVAAGGFPLASSATAPPPPPARKQTQSDHTVQQPTSPGTKSVDAGLATEVVVAHKAAEHNEKSSAGTQEMAEAPQPAAATPFAAATPAAAAGPKNEFAEKLAARALANASKAKSSLLTGSSLTGSSSLTLTSVASGTAAADEDSTGTFVAPAHPFGRPRLNLKPRSVPLPDNLAAPDGVNTSSSSASSDSGTDAGEKDSTISVASSAAARPRLQLQPRTLPLVQDVPIDASSRPRLNLLPRGSSGVERLGSTASDDAKQKPSLFGEAKPREEVLKGRGMDPLDLPRTNGTSDGTTRLSEAAVAKLGGSFNSGSRYIGSHSSVSGADDEWQVAGHGRRGSSKLSQDMNSSAALLLNNDPFFGSSSRGYNTPATRALNRDILRDGKGYSARGSGSFGDEGYGSFGKRGSYFGSPARSGWSGKGGHVDDGDAQEGDVFTRALPTRQAPLAL